MKLGMFIEYDMGWCCLLSSSLVHYVKRLQLSVIARCLLTDDNWGQRQAADTVLPDASYVVIVVAQGTVFTRPDGRCQDLS